MSYYKIAIVSTDTSSVTVSNLTSELSNLGHTATTYAYNSVTAEILQNFDLIITARLLAATQSDTAIMAAVAAGIPAILDGTQDGSGTYQTVGSGVPNALGLIYSLASIDASTALTFGSTGPSQFNDFKSSSISVNTTAPNYRWSAPVVNLISSGTSIAAFGSYIGVALFAKGSATSTVTALGASVVLAPWLYSNGGSISLAGREIIGAMIEWVVAGSETQYRITGTVSDSNNQPLQRLLRAFDKASGKFVGETTSAADGSYKLTTPTNKPVSVVCYHDSSDTNNSQVKDDIVPILDE